MSDFQFANKDWSAGLWVVLAVVAALLWLQRQRGNALSSVMSAVMQARLVSRPSNPRRWLSVMLLGFAGICFVVALMRPQFGLTYMKSPRVGAQIMFCLDVSKSMLAEDTAPNRLERAKADITDLLSLLDGDQVGLIGFAGRASVLCPLTPDYGFFKLVLDSAGPQSVGRGGTRLEEPIRKALDGFRTESDVSRVLFLITDGEDHDSHPLDAASEAVERGIHFVTVGLGDEAGSEIRITDPRTGVQTQVRDNDGNPVITRLDGETLRALALETEGVYIPAGTGTLDLKSIYDAHIQPLVRGEMQAEGRPVRQDAFQWAILAGIVFLMAGLVLGSGPQYQGPSSLVPGERAVAGGIFLRAGTSSESPVAGGIFLRAGTSSESPSPSGSLARAMLAILILAPTNPATADQQATTDKSDGNSEAAAELAPRETYNRGLKQMQSDLDLAESLLTKARQDAAGDGEVRYRATYNMGWVQIRRADKMIEQQPAEALKHLQAAAGWFRDGVRLRSDAADARHNLEVVLLRIMQLRDQLAGTDDQNLSEQLDALIAKQRQQLARLRGLVQQVTASDDPNIADQFRSQFQRLAVDQRVATSDLQGVVETASGELESLGNKQDAERTPEENVRAAQLAGLLAYLDQANQRFGQSRSQLRRRQAERGFRRAAMGLNELKRARDQLRQPLEILDGILADASSIAQQTAMKSLGNQLVTSESTAVKVPSWITQDYLADSQSDLSQRTDQLTTQLAAGLEANQSRDSSDSQQPLTPEQQDFLKKLQRAMPHLKSGTQAMKRADQKVALAEYAEAGEQQIAAISSLREAREQFADLRTLIELAYGTQLSISDAVAGLTQNQQQVEADGSMPRQEYVEEIAGFMAQSQERNLQRMGRLKQEVEMAKSRVESPAGQSGQPADQPSSELERLDLASVLVDRATGQMRELLKAIPARDHDEEEAADTAEKENDAGESTSDPAENYSGVQQQAGAAVETLEELRRLFFSITEHLQETAQRQADLNDETEQAAVMQLEADETAATDPEQSQMPPEASSEELDGSQQLASRQDELAETAKQIAEALQREPDPATSDTSQNDLTAQQRKLLDENAEKAQTAAGLVSEASEQMKQASTHLVAPGNELAEARPIQDQALEKLIEALQHLQPPNQNQPDQQQPQQDSQPQQQTQQSSGTRQQQQENTDDEKMDATRILQAVRDREAQRRRDRDRQQQAGSVPVEKDW